MLLRVWLYDFYDMGYFTELLDGHVINICTLRMAHNIVKIQIR